MRLTTRGRYSVTAMLDIALHGKNSCVNLLDLSRRQGLSLAYLEQIFAKLRRSALVVSVRGPGGGYRLARSAERIFIVDIIDAVNEEVDATRCHGKKNCHGNSPCLTHNLWEGLSDLIRGYLSKISLAELLLPGSAVNHLVEIQKPEGMAENHH